MKRQLQIVSFGILSLLMSSITVTVAQKTYSQNPNRNFFEEHWQAKTINDFTEFVDKPVSSTQSDATIIIYLNDSLNKILPTNLGVNSTFRSKGIVSGESTDVYSKSGWGAYRYPAGSGSNLYFWDGNTTQNQVFKQELRDGVLEDITGIDGLNDSYVIPSEFVTFQSNLTSEATVVVNYFYARYGTTAEGTREARVLQAAKYAAGFVNKMNIELNANIKYWEIGNECYGAWEEGYVVDGVTMTGTEYGEDFRVFAEEMKKVDPNINVGAVVYSSDDPDHRYGNWNKEVMAEVENHADFMVVHNYFTSEGDGTVENILASTVQIEEIKTMLENVVETYTDKDRDYFPVAMTEYNCRGMQTATMLNSLFTAELIGEFVKNKYGLATRWVGEWRGSDSDNKGTITIDDVDQDPYTARSPLLVYHFYDKWFGDYLINASCSADGIKSYASRFSDGKTGVVIINQTSESKNIDINIADLDENNLGNAYYYSLYANDMNVGNKKFYVNGQTSMTAGGGPNNFDEILPYKTAIRNNGLINVPQYSVTFVVIDTDLQISTSVGMNNSLNNSDLRVYPNPFTNSIYIDSKNLKSIKILDIYGRNLISESKSEINTSELKSGTYFVQVETYEGIKVNKMIKH